MIDEGTFRIGALLFEQHYDAMMRQAKRHVSDTYDAEDIVSSCWLRLLPKINILQGMDTSTRTAYLLTVVWHETVDYYRQNMRHHSDTVELDESIIDSNSDEAYDKFILCDTLSTLLEKIPPQEARIVRCKMKEMNNKDIAEQPRISLSTVRVY